MGTRAIAEVARIASAAAAALALAGCGGTRAPAPSALIAGDAPGASTPAFARAADAPLRVIVAGDVLPHRPRLVDPARIAAALAPLRPLFAEADATIANYETATGDPDDLTAASERIALAAPPGWMTALAGARVTAITGANNHACDLGEAGLDATVRAAGAAEVTPIGVDPRDPWRARVVAEANGRRVCAVAWSTFVNEPIAGCVASGKIAVADFRKRGLSRVERAITEARTREHCDAVIAILHGGDEYVAQVAGPIAQATRAALAGADVVVIHHPHVPSPVDVVATPDGRRVPIFASLGNLVSNQGESWKPAYLPVRPDRRVVSLNAWTRLGVLADLRFHWPAGAAAGARAELEWGYHLVWTENEHAIDHAAKMPRITARLFDPRADRAIQDKLATDRGGPGALFAGPCWIEASGRACL